MPAAKARKQVKNELEVKKDRPLRGRGGTQNFPNARKLKMDTPEEREGIAKLLRETTEAYKMPRVHSDEELADRFAHYYERCAEQVIIPTVEEMYLYTGYSVDWARDVLYGAKKGFSPETKNIIKQAKQYMKTFDAKLVVEGKQNPIVYFFRSKNYYDMVDKQEVTVTPNRQDASDFNAEDIKKRYLTEMQPDVELDGFVDDK